MKICIYGAGAIGGLLGGRLAAARHDVTLIARGVHLEAMRAGGLRLEDRGEVLHAHPRCTDDPAQAGIQDYVILTMKAHGVAAAARRLAPLMGPETAVVTLQNGLPWWYFLVPDGAPEPRPLRSVDPGGEIVNAIAAGRVIGGVANAASSVPEPGLVRCLGGGAFILGELDGAGTDRCRALAEAMTASGFLARVTARIRDEIWAKLLGNVSFSAIAVLTRSPLGRVVANPELRELARQIMEETVAVAAALGAALPVTIDQRLEVSAGMGGHKTSILQDLEAGRPMEVDAMVGSVIEAGRVAGVATPLTDTIYALVRQCAVEAGCYPENAPLAALLQASGT